MSNGTEAEAGHLVGFPISPELHARVREVLSILREAESASDHASELARVVAELTDTGLGYYFLRPVEVAGMGRISQATAKVGIASAGKGIPMIVRRVLSSASDEELLALADFVETLLVELVPE